MSMSDIQTSDELLRGAMNTRKNAKRKSQNS